MTSVKIAAVSYLNTIPITHGTPRADIRPDAELLVPPPSGCADAVRDGRADIALVPVAEIPALPDIEIFGNHCIGAVGSVRTVVLLSASPVEELREIRLDAHSRTSVALARILAAERWGVDPVWTPLEDYVGVRPEMGVGYLLIGDKVFDFESRFPQRYDLADEWRALTGLPFVFAAWVARRGTASGTLEQLEAALAYGVRHIPEAVREDGRMAHAEAVRYLTENIDFRLDAPKRKALELYWEKKRRYAARRNPG